MSYIAITNNALFYEKYKNEFEIQFYDIGIREIMVNVRDMVHKGHKVLTHPLSGSVKPNETYIKTIFVSKEVSSLDIKSLSLIENSIITCDKFVQRHFTYSNARNDFETVDMSLAESALQSLILF